LNEGKNAGLASAGGKDLEKLCSVTLAASQFSITTPWCCFRSKILLAFIYFYGNSPGGRYEPALGKFLIFGAAGKESVSFGGLILLESPLIGA